MNTFFRTIKKALGIKENPQRSTFLPNPEFSHSLKTQLDALKSLPYRDRRYAECRLVIFDTETTGLEPYGDDEIISLSAVGIRNGKLIPGDTFDRLVDPKRPIPPLATEITGITEGMVQGQGNIFEVLKDFLDYVGSDILIAHHADFDLAFINKRLRQCGAKLTIPVIDTFTLSRSLYPTRKHHGLDALLQIYGIEQKNHQRHSSLGDSFMTAEVFFHLIEELRSRKPIHRIGDIIHHLKWRSYY